MLQVPVVKHVNRSVCVTECFSDVYTAPAGHGSRRLIDTLACLGGSLVRPLQLQLQLQYRQSAPIHVAGLRASVAPPSISEVSTEGVLRCCRGWTSA